MGLELLKTGPRVRENLWVPETVVLPIMPIPTRGGLPHLKQNHRMYVTPADVSKYGLDLFRWTPGGASICPGIRRRDVV